MQIIRKILSFSILLLLPFNAYAADTAAEPQWAPKVLGMQFSWIGQSLSPFSSSPYSGAHSLMSTGDRNATQSYGLYLGSQLTNNLQAYLDIEMLKGLGISNAVGLAGVTNGDVLRQGSTDLGTEPYVARAFLKYIIPIGTETQEQEKGMDQLPVNKAMSNITVKLGKMGVTDDFDTNRYANSGRTQFMNWGLISNTAWDYAADTRGYTNGLMIHWINPTWSLKYGIYQMPTFANGNILDDLNISKGENIELTLNPNNNGTIVRILGFNNIARMGNYNAAIAASTPPNIVANDTPGRTKYGYGINIEQPIADNGDTGMFARYGWNDGKNESFAFTETDEHLSIGGQVSGTHWGRNNDILGLAFLQHGLSADHIRYLALGGQGFLLGDGKLNYGKETIIESYYNWRLNEYAMIGPDVQYIINPGYNQDRGPAFVVSFRIHLEY
jgi:hypothetical protein